MDTGEARQSRPDVLAVSARRTQSVFADCVFASVEAKTYSPGCTALAKLPGPERLYRMQGMGINVFCWDCCFEQKRLEVSHFGGRGVMKPVGNCSPSEVFGLVSSGELCKNT